MQKSNRTLLNNIGIMRRLEQNYTDCLYYYKKAADIALKIGDKSLIHITLQNLIHSYLFLGQKDEANKYYEIYRQTISDDNLNDVIEFSNFQLEYARQSEDITTLTKTVESTSELRGLRLKKSQKLAFDIAELRIRANSSLSLKSHLDKIEGNIDEYNSLKFPERFHAIKEINAILEMLYQTKQLGHFRGLFNRTIDLLYRMKAEVDDYILNIPDYCVAERCYWLKQKVFLTKFVHLELLYLSSVEKESIRQETLNHRFQLLLDIRNIQLSHENFFEALRTDLDIADEGMGQGRIDKVRKHTDRAVEGLDLIKSHPGIFEFSLRIAMYYSFLGDHQKANRYFNIFKKSGQSPLHYAKWLQRYYGVLNQKLGS